MSNLLERFSQHKKTIILVLLTILFFLGAGIVLIQQLSSRKPQPEQANTPVELIPTGILIPTQEIKQGELDIVGIKPQDNDTKVKRNSTIEIQFSQPFKENDVQFFVGPEVAYDQSVSGNMLRITPHTPLAEGTLYTFSVNFTDDPQKVRLYRFTTEGKLQDTLPDTQDKGAYEQLLNEERVKYPDIFVTNNTPYENEYFSIRSEFEPTIPAHHFFIVTSKNENKELVKQMVNLWLQTLNMGNQQIQQLDIRYD